MNILEIFNLFAVSPSSQSCFENQTIFEAKVETATIKNFDKGALSSFISLIPSRDRYSLSIKGELSEAISLSQNGNIDQFVASYRTLLSTLETDEVVVCSLRIAKVVDNNTISVYAINDLLTTVEGFSFPETLKMFGQILADNAFIFEVLDDRFLPMETQTFIFRSFKDGTVKKQRADRISILNKVKSVTHIAGDISQYLIPEDFNLATESSQYSNLNNLFKKLSLFTCVASIFDITTVVDDGFSYKLNGYKSFEKKIIFKTLSAKSLPEYLSIYYWIYEGGNLNDKIGLAKNIISLNLDPSTLELSGMPFQSIRSGFEIYLKQNIKQYIEIRNKISDQLLDFNKRATTIVDAFASSFQKSALAVLTTFGTVLAIKYLGTSTLSISFVNNATTFSLIFIGVSIAALIISHKDVSFQQQRFEDSYKNMKERYTDLLTQEDIEKILNKDKEHMEDLKYIETKTRWYIILWLSVLVAVLGFVGCFHYSVKADIYSIAFLRYLIGSIWASYNFTHKFL